MIGDKIHTVDFFWGMFYVNFFDRDIRPNPQRWDDCIAQYPKFKAYGERFKNLDTMKNYLATRPKKK